jgi:hypothetical protein
MEALVFKERWCDLFKPEELVVARKRLDDLGTRPAAQAYSLAPRNAGGMVARVFTASLALSAQAMRPIAMSDVVAFARLATGPALVGSLRACFARGKR